MSIVRSLVFAGLAAVLPAQDLAQVRKILGSDQPRAQVLVLGSFHMANNNLDLVKSDWDDMRSPRRQMEIREVLDGLKAFRPTKIAVEVPLGDTAVNAQFARYAKDSYTLTANEIDQVAFRLAKELGHTRLWPVDWKKDMDFDTAFAFAAKHGQGEILQKAQAFGKSIEAIQQRGKGMSVRQILLEAADPAFELETHRGYLLMAEIGDGRENPGADMVAGWMERNLKIAMNVVRLAEPGDRILVLIGAGHAKLLKEYLRESPRLAVADARDFLK